MSTATTIRMIAAYIQLAQPTMFLSGFFQSPPRNFYNSEKVEVDVVRGDEDVAVVLTDLSTGYRLNETDKFTNKQFTPPIFKEKVGISAFDLLNRMPGDTPFEDPNFRLNVIGRIFQGITAIENKIRRAIEEQAAQVLQTGTVTLKDANGVARYTIDYSPKATHFVTAGTAWDAPGDPLGDISSLAEVIRSDSFHEPDQLLFGIDAYTAFVNDTDVRALMDNRRINIGDVGRSTVIGNGARRRGSIDIGNYTYDMFTYGAKFKDVETGVSTPYITPAKVIMRASDGRMDATFGLIPNIGRELGVGGTNLLPELPSRINGPDVGIDLALNAWLTDDGEHLFAGVGSRPLMIPTAIDTYGTIATGV